MFVLNGIRISLQDLISDVNSKGSVNTSFPTRSNLYGSTQGSDVA